MTVNGYAKYLVFQVENHAIFAPTENERTATWMDEYIKRGDVLRAYEEEQHRQGSYRFETLIKSVPSAEVADVVRCRNCIGRSTWYNDAEYGCAVCGMSGMYPKSEDGFCSYGIRKDGAD